MTNQPYIPRYVPVFIALGVLLGLLGVGFGWMILLTGVVLGVLALMYITGHSALVAWLSAPIKEKS